MLAKLIVLNDWWLAAAAQSASVGLHHTTVHEIRRDADNRVKSLCNV